MSLHVFSGLGVYFPTRRISYVQKAEHILEVFTVPFIKTKYVFNFVFRLQHDNVDKKVYKKNVLFANSN